LPVVGTKRPRLVPGEGLEPPTNGLQNRCSTAELTRRRDAIMRAERNISRAGRSQGTAATQTVHEKGRRLAPPALAFLPLCRMRSLARSWQSLTRTGGKSGPGDRMDPRPTGIADSRAGAEAAEAGRIPGAEVGRAGTGAAAEPRRTLCSATAQQVQSTDVARFKLPVAPRHGSAGTAHLRSPQLPRCNFVP
jgi:hypothetical protein